MLGGIAIVLGVCNAILISWFVLRPVSRVQVMFTMIDGTHVCLTARPEHWPGQYVIISQIPSKMSGLVVRGCTITILQLNRVIDVTFAEAVSLHGALQLVIDKKTGDGLIQFTDGPKVTF